MKQQFKIEHGIPYRGHAIRGVNETVPLSKMKVGDSVVLEDEYDDKKYANWYSRLRTQVKREGIQDKVTFRMGKHHSGDKTAIRLWVVDKKE